MRIQSESEPAPLTPHSDSLLLVLLLGDLVDQPLPTQGRSDIPQSLTFHLFLRAPGFGAHVGQEGDVVHLDESVVDVGFVGEDV